MKPFTERSAHTLYNTPITTPPVPYLRASKVFLDKLFLLLDRTDLKKHLAQPPVGAVAANKRDEDHRQELVQ